MTQHDSSNTKKKPVRPIPLGQTVITRGVQSSVPPAELLRALSRHASGDWGEIHPDDWAENELAVKQGFRILSAYTSQSAVKFWVITEADRSSTTILLPEEY